MERTLGRTSSLADQRLRDIEVLLLWEGQVGNSRLRELYDVGLGAASVLIKAYREAYPDCCQWNSVERVFEAVPGFVQAVLSEGVVTDYAELLQRSHGVEGAVTFDGHIDLTCANSEIFSLLHRACSRGLAVEIVHASMNSPEPRAREIFPQRLVQAGRRWHVRGLDLKLMEYRDFTLGRISAAKLGQATWPENAPLDHAWNSDVTFQIIPHPLLNQAQSRVIRAEYMGAAAARRITCRAAMVQYVIQDLRIAVDLEKELPPSFQLAIANIKPIEGWLFPS